MRTIQTETRFPLKAVKPLEGLMAYRQGCLEATQRALRSGTRRRQVSPVSGQRLVPFGRIGGLDYARCPMSGSVFLVEVPEPKAWKTLLAEAAGLRQAPSSFHQALADSRADHVHLPKLEWIQGTLRLQGVSQARLVEVSSPSSELHGLLQSSSILSLAHLADEITWGRAGFQTAPLEGQPFDAAVLPETLDRVDDPRALLKTVQQQLKRGGLLFVTALVFSGYDMAVLGAKNLYLYPPDRTNCFTRFGLETLLGEANFSLVEVSTPGVLDLEIVRAHRMQDPTLILSGFDRQMTEADEETRQEFQAFLQKRGLSSFARIVARKEQ